MSSGSPSRLLANHLIPGPHDLGDLDGQIVRILRLGLVFQAEDTGGERGVPKDLLEPQRTS